MTFLATGIGFIVGVFFGIFTTALLVAGHHEEEDW